MPTKVLRMRVTAEALRHMGIPFLAQQFQKTVETYAKNDIMPTELVFFGCPTTDGGVEITFYPTR